jgi:beta-phosphoglucomutase-like phosphatase (HAD superfamily)
MYAAAGVPRERDILHELRSMTPERAASARAAIEAAEADALANMQLTAGSAALGDWCAARGVPLGLVTRNTQATVTHFHACHWAPRPPFAPAVARDAGLEHKPSPAALLHCAAAWGVRPEECVMVGDSPKDDVVAGRRAGMTTVYVSCGRTAGAAAELEGEKAPHHTIESLEALPALLERLFIVTA